MIQTCLTMNLSIHSSNILIFPVLLDCYKTDLFFLKKEEDKTMFAKSADIFLFPYSGRINVFLLKHFKIKVLPLIVP